MDKLDIRKDAKCGRIKDAARDAIIRRWRVFQGSIDIVRLDARNESLVPQPAHNPASAVAAEVKR